MDNVAVADAPPAPVLAAPAEHGSRVYAAFAQNYDFVWRLLRRLGISAADADDAAQHVFMTFAKKIDSIEPAKERTFLYGTTIKVAANARRAANRRNAPAAISEPDASPSLPDDLTEASRLRALLDEILACLSDDLRRVLVLAEIEQYQVDEIAALEGVPVGTAASRLRRARQRFRELLAERNHRNPYALGGS